MVLNKLILLGSLIPILLGTVAVYGQNDNQDDGQQLFVTNESSNSSENMSGSAIESNMSDDTISSSPLESNSPLQTCIPALQPDEICTRSGMNGTESQSNGFGKKPMQSIPGGPVQ